MVYVDLTKDEKFMQMIEYYGPLTYTDFYIDMKGKGGTMNKENYIKYNSALPQTIVGFISFPLIHAAGSKIGLFPYFFCRKK